MVAGRIIRPHTNLAATGWRHTSTLARTFGVDELYQAIDWLLQRRNRIQGKPEDQKCDVTAPGRAVCSSPMRPHILYPLFEPVTRLEGVGPQTASLVGKVAGARAVDLLWLLPSGVIDRNPLPSLAAAAPGRIATVAVTVGHRQRPHSNRQPWRIGCRDDCGERLDLVFFRAREPWLDRELPPGARRLVSGRIERYGEALQMVHPDHITHAGGAAGIPPVEPVYPLTEGLTTRTLRKIIAQALARAPSLPEWQDGAWLERRGWPSWNEALERVHRPRDTAMGTHASERLAFDELLAEQLALALVRATRRQVSGRSVKSSGELAAGMMAALAFAMTPAQDNAVRDILEDMARPHRMLRLLQGDVGSGKTLVALHAMLTAAEAGHQAALIAPTGLLAHQHRHTIRELIAGTDTSALLLTGADRGRVRADKLDRIAGGEARLVVGTHALITEGVDFHDLALVVVDEQHRFGVHQRLQLGAKGRHVDTLVMTATPIPRTLQMTEYGDLDVTRLDGRPPGRRAVETRALPLARLEDVVAALVRAVHKGERAYWICPLVEANGDDGIAAAEQRLRHLVRIFGARAALVHGRLPAAEKEEVMERFASGDVAVLVATTVIEVGLDVPEATIMVIEHAERFGLAQLHQLRGRVGRGAAPSSCLLLYAAPLGEAARARIDMLRRSDDGFEIAEQDLVLRGGGELLGARQSGAQRFRIAELPEQSWLLDAACDDARLVLARDPELAGERGRALRLLLHLFERQAAVRLLESG